MRGIFSRKRKSPIRTVVERRAKTMQHEFDIPGRQEQRFELETAMAALVGKLESRCESAVNSGNGGQKKVAANSLPQGKSVSEKQKKAAEHPLTAGKSASERQEKAAEHPLPERMPGIERQEKMAEHPPLKRKPGNGGPENMGGRSASSPVLAALVEPGSVVAEQFRKLKARIHRMNASRSLKTIMITSPMCGEGKSFMAANLGVTLARESNNRVLLIDCDLQNPGLTKYFGLENERGLSDYIQTGGEPRELVKETGIERLRILPAGIVEGNPADLIESNKMKALLNELNSQDETEFIIIDSTPILATTAPEVLSALVDGVIFVVRAGVTPRETVEQALVSLEPQKILGAVLNDLVFKTPGLRSTYFGTNGYYYRYGYGNGGGEKNAGDKKRKMFRFGWRKKENGKGRKIAASEVDPRVKEIFDRAQAEADRVMRNPKQQ